MISVFHAELLQKELNSDFDAMRISMAAMATNAEIHGGRTVLNAFMSCYAQNMDFKQAIESVIEQYDEPCRQAMRLKEQAKQILALHLDGDNETVN